MRDLDHLRDLLAHAAWADARFLACWGASGATGDLEIRERMAHASGTMELFLDVLQDRDILPWDDILSGRVAPPWKDRQTPEFHALKAWTQDLHARCRTFAMDLDEDTAQRRVTIPWFPEPPCVVSAAEALVQVAMHTQHHRGQNFTRLKALGGKTTNVDYLIWRWKDCPPAPWA